MKWSIWQSYFPVSKQILFWTLKNVIQWYYNRFTECLKLFTCRTIICTLHCSLIFNSAKNFFYHYSLDYVVIKVIFCYCKYLHCQWYVFLVHKITIIVWELLLIFNHLCLKWNVSLSDYQLQLLQIFS